MHPIAFSTDLESRFQLCREHDLAGSLLSSRFSLSGFAETVNILPSSQRLPRSTPRPRKPDWPGPCPRRVLLIAGTPFSSI